MSYETIYACANDRDLLARITAGAAAEGSATPDGVMHQTRWAIASASDVEAAYASALAAGNPRPGNDPAVITDAMILGLLQANWPPDPPT